MDNTLGAPILLDTTEFPVPKLMKGLKSYKKRIVWNSVNKTKLQRLELSKLLRIKTSLRCIKVVGTPRNLNPPQTCLNP